jgi:hypothetical protein
MRLPENRFFRQEIFDLLGARFLGVFRVVFAPASDPKNSQLAPSFHNAFAYKEGLNHGDRQAHKNGDSERKAVSENL